MHCGIDHTKEDILHSHRTLQLGTAPTLHWPGRGLHHRGQAVHEEVPRLADVDYVEDDPLVLLRVLDTEEEPEPVTRIAGVRPDVDVVLGVRHEVHPPEVGRLEGGLEGEMSLLSLARVTRRSDDEPGDVGLTALVLTVAVPHHCRTALADWCEVTTVGLYSVTVLQCYSVTASLEDGGRPTLGINYSYM